MLIHAQHISYYTSGRMLFKDVNFSLQKGERAESQVIMAPVNPLYCGSFLFLPDSWDKLCAVLSGGEMLRLALCCMILQNKAPDMIFLDEPVNNLDLSNIQLLAKVFAGYRGALIVISHDAGFLEDAGVSEQVLIG